MKQQLTCKFRLRDKHAAELKRQARAVNFVWNYCNEAQRHVLRWDRWLSYVDLARLTAGAGKELGLHAHTVQRVCRAYGTCPDSSVRGLEAGDAGPIALARCAAKGSGRGGAVPAARGGPSGRRVRVGSLEDALDGRLYQAISDHSGL